MDALKFVAENILREAVAEGKFDGLEGSGKPLDLSRNPFEDPLAPTLRRILRDNGATHPLIEARRALEEEIARLRAALRTSRRNGSWDYGVQQFRKQAADLNREIKFNNLRAPIPNFHVHVLDIEAEIAAAAESE